MKPVLGMEPGKTDIVKVHVPEKVFKLLVLILK
jgi:hypothetical protein